MSAARKPTRPNATRSERRQAAAKRRRELTRHASDGPGTLPPPRSGRRRVLAVTGMVVALVLIATGVVVLLRDDDGPDLSLRGRRVTTQAPEQKLSKTPATYRAQYRIETEGGGQQIVEERTVRAPYDVRYVVANEGQLATPLFTSVRTRTRTSDRNGAAPATMAQATPALHPWVTRLDATLNDLVANGFFTRRERRELNDIECTVYRTGAAIVGGDIIKATETRYADVCVADDGIPIEQVAVRSGVVELRVTLLTLQRDPVVADGDFAVVDDPVALKEGGVVVADLPIGELPTSTYWRFTTTPSGWTLASRHRVEVTKLDEGVTGPAVTKTSWVDIFTRGTDIVILRQGPSGEQPAKIETTNGIDTKVGALGDAKIVYDAVGHTIVVDNVDGRFVQLAGTASAAELAALGAALSLG